jgi:hypothetical protein
LTPDLTITTRHGIEIDLCPKCRGIWLDRGELDKIVTRAAGPDPDEDHDFDDENEGRYSRRGARAGRRQPWWTELFD